MDFITNAGETLQWPFENVEPREVQIEALKKGFGKTGFAYLMRQRTGKTWTAFAEYSILYKQDKVKWFILICPNSLKHQWRDAVWHVDPFTPLLIYTAQGKHKAAKFFENNKQGGVIIVNYESLATFNALMLNDLFTDFRKYFIEAYIACDESTKIKDHASRTCKAALRLSEECKYKRILTGRPRANNNADLWSQYAFIGHRPRNYFVHRTTFCLTGGMHGSQIFADINTEMLQREIEPISYIADDKYVAMFEKRYEPMIKIDLAGKLADYYKKLQAELLMDLSEDTKVSAPLIITKYLRLQQISSGIVGDDAGVQHNLVEPDKNPKIKETLDILDTYIENKVIIVCRFSLSMKNLYDTLTAKGYKVSVMSGKMKPDQMEKMKADFNNGPNNILIGQIQVLSYGHTLCGSADSPCDSIIFYENDFSIINRTQCESRPENMDRKTPIYIYDMYASGMDKYMLNKLIAKEEASLALMNYGRQYGMRPEGKLIDKEVDKEYAL